MVRLAARTGRQGGREAERQGGRQTNSHSDKQTDTKADRQRDRYTNRYDWSQPEKKISPMGPLPALRQNDPWDWSHP